MKHKYRILSFLFIPLLIVSIIGGCGGSGDSGSSSSTRDMIMVEGTIADVVANAKKSEKSHFFTSIFNFFKPTLDAIAQTDDPDDLSGITVQAIDTEGLIVGEAVSDPNGNFSIEIPCDEPVSLLFLLDDSTIEIGGLNFPCPADSAGSTVFITVTLDLNDDGGDIEIEEENDPSAAVLGCSGNDDVDIDDEDVIIDGEGGPCIITTGDCQLSIDNSVVSLVGCSTCIDARGDSSVDIDTASFECVADDTGIRSVGNSSVDIDVDSNEIDDEFTDLLIEAGIVAVDARGNSDIDLEADDEDSDDVDDSQGSFESFIEILGGETSISAVGSSDVDVDADDCIIDPEQITVIGNADVEIDCDGESIDDEDSDSDFSDDVDSDSDMSVDDMDSDSDLAVNDESDSDEIDDIDSDNRFSS